MAESLPLEMITDSCVIGFVQANRSISLRGFAKDLFEILAMIEQQTVCCGSAALIGILFGPDIQESLATGCR